MYNVHNIKKVVILFYFIIQFKKEIPEICNYHIKVNFILLKHSFYSILGGFYCHAITYNHSSF